MNKLHSIIRYECSTSFKYIWMFYAVQYAIVLLASLIITTNAFGSLEMNTFIYVGVLGALGFTEDFKMLIQHGFTRKYIFIATLSLFAFISGIMAIVDTIAGNVLHSYIQSYNSLYGNIYGYENIFSNFLWLFMVYMSFCCLSFMIILIINKIGKTYSILASIVFGGSIMLSVALLKYSVSDDIKSGLLEFAMNAFGFMSNGTVNHILPLVTLLIFVGVLGIGSYSIIRLTDLK